MSAKTKIVVLHMKELIYTLIFAGLGILLIFLLLFMFLPGKEDGESVETMRYVAGVYHVIDPVWRACGGYAGDCG